MLTWVLSSAPAKWVVSRVLDGWWRMFSRGTHGDLSAVSRLHISAPVYDGQWPFIV